MRTSTSAPARGRPGPLARARVRPAALAGMVVAAVAVVVGLATALPLAVTAGPAQASASELFRLSDPRLDEASGLGVGIASPGILYAQNDSGDSARFFALNATTGATVAVCDVPDATNVDWEDLAVARDAAGVPSVWLADIGDNNEDRPEVDLYRVDEPHVLAGQSATELSTSRPDVWRLRYPDGAHNAESIVVNPASHRMYVITKSFFGASAVYQLPAQPSATTVQTMTKVGELQFDPTGTAGGPNVIGQLTATGASMSADGSVLVVRTYTDAYFWTVGAGDVPAAIKAAPKRIPLPEQPQGEGIALRAGSALVDSEGVGTPVYSVPQPPLAAPTRSAASSAPGRASRSSAASGSSSPGGLASVTSGSGRSGPDDALILVGALLGGVAVVLLGCWAALTYQRRRFRP
jgi:hypothetical protein